MNYHSMILFFILFPVLVMSHLSCSKAPASTSLPGIIPLPAQMSSNGESFRIKATTKIILDTREAGMLSIAGQLEQLIGRTAGVHFGMNSNPRKNAIVFKRDTSLENEESYNVLIEKEGVYIRYKHPRGAYYAVETIRQLLPPGLEGKDRVKRREIYLPGYEIHDQPRFPYRGMHLDVARHFFPVEFIKRYIDLMAGYKFNHFHWHLTDDQGWRIEIKAYPELTNTGAWRNETLVGHYRDQPHQFDGQRYGGYYTQDEIREVIQYASERFITVIPEIEMPGHSIAALASYPWLGCFPDKGYEVATTWGVFEDVFCPKEETFEFLEKVLLEVMALFPSSYIHIGGDECPKTSWKKCPHCQQLIRDLGLNDEHELQSYFITRMEKFLNAHGRNIIGWDEILEGGLAPNATVMSWRGVQGGIEAARMGHKAIMTPVSHCYFDYYQSKDSLEPLAIGGFLPLERVYEYEPIPEELEESQRHLILGVQGNVWTEYMKTTGQVEYMILPRMPALSEVAWTPADLRDFSSFQKRLHDHRTRYDILNLNYAKHIFETTNPATSHGNK
jgi:hexosaminidase